MNTIPWTYRTFSRATGQPALAVEGDIMDLDGMFALPNHHRNKSHSTPATIDKRIQDRDAGEEDGFYQARNHAEVRYHCTVAGRDDVTGIVTRYLANDTMRETIRMSGRRASRPRSVYGDEGEEIDMDRWHGGEEDTAWRRLERKETMRKSRIVVVDTNVIIPAFWTQEEYAWSGVQAAVIIDALEAEGYRVEVNVLQAVTVGGNTAFCSRVRVKRAEDPLRLDLLAYQTGCAAVARSALWRCIHVHTGHIEAYGHNDMGPAEVRSLAYECAADDRKPDHVLPAVRDKNAAIANIQAVLDHYHAPVEA